MRRLPNWEALQTAPAAPPAAAPPEQSTAAPVAPAGPLGVDTETGLAMLVCPACQGGGLVHRSVHRRGNPSGPRVTFELRCRCGADLVFWVQVDASAGRVYAAIELVPLAVE